MTRTVFTEKGFTLIELIVTMTIMVTLSSFGLASYVSYSRSQALQNATQDVVTTLQSAKASATSQVKPATCIAQGKTLDGYTVKVTLPHTYTIGPVCSGELWLIESKEKTLPAYIVFSAPLTVTFHTVNGVIEGYGDVELEQTQSGLKKKIEVFPDGRINVSNVSE